MIISQISVLSITYEYDDLERLERLERLIPDFQAQFDNKYNHRQLF